MTSAWLRWLLLMTHTAERQFPAQVLDDPAYHELLEGLDVGVSWQRTLMEGVTVLERVTGVALSDTAWEHYQQGRFMSRNNLWGLQKKGGD